MVIGSQAAWVQFPDLPEEMMNSPELDIFPRLRPDLADLIEGSIGRDSIFHETHGYYADAVGPETAKLPPGWEERAVRLRGDGDVEVTAPEIHDLAVSKLIAGRPKDLDWLLAGVRASLIDVDQVRSALDTMSEPPEILDLARARLTKMAYTLKSKGLGI